MSASGDWSTPWSRRRAGQRSDLCDMADIRTGVADSLRQILLLSLDGAKPAELTCEVIASKRQSACLIERTGETAILFDVSQSLVLNRLLDLIRGDQPYDEFARLLGACAGLSVADKSPALCEALLSLPVPQEAEYLHRLEDVFRHYQYFQQLLPRILFEWQHSLVNSYFLAHEVAHFRLRKPDRLMIEVKASAEQAFEFAMSQVCYEDRSNFEEIASHYGALSKDQEHLDRLRRDLVNRRRHYETNRDHLIEEIACDAYALMSITNRHMSIWRPDPATSREVLDAYLGFSQSFFLILTLSDLHQAMIQRAKLSVGGGINSEKPGDIADMHFRKMALMCSIAHQGMSALPESDRTEQAAMAILEEVARLLGAQKQALDALFVIPVTRVIRSCILEFEGNRTSSLADVEAAPWRQRLGVAFGEKRTRATFTKEATDRLIGTIA